MEDIINFFKNFEWNLDADFFVKKDLKKQMPIILKISNLIPNTPFVEYDVKDLFISSIIKELTSSIISNIFKNSINTKNIFCINLNGIKPDDRTRYFTKSVLNTDSKYFLTNGRICSEYLKNSVFWADIFNITSFSLNNSKIIKAGMISTKEVWIDNNITWKNNYVLSFDSIFIDISNFQIKQLEYINNRHLETSLELRFNINNPIIHFFFEEEHMENWDRYRDDKIDYILNDKEIGSNSQFSIYRDDKLEP